MLYKIYIVMTIVLIILLMFGGLDLFESSLLAFGTAGTGGFGVRNGSILPYNNPYIEIVLGIGMIVFGVNFNIYYFILIGKVKDVLKNEELRYYLLIVFGAITLIVLNICKTYTSLAHCIRDVFFSVSSVITTTGYSTADFGKWPLFSQVILKISRVVLMVKIYFAEIIQMISPNRVIAIKSDDKPVNVKMQKSIAVYFLIYSLVFGGILLIISYSVDDFITAFSAVAATFNNIGPGLGKVGPAFSFAELNNFSKIVLSFGMLAGRLEIFPMLILFSPTTWKLK